MTGTPFYIYILLLSLKATRLNTTTLLYPHSQTPSTSAYTALTHYAHKFLKRVALRPSAWPTPSLPHPTTTALGQTRSEHYSLL